MPVDSFAPNAWGLYNVHGNVKEWVQDCWHDSYLGAPRDGSGWTTGECNRRVFRGGSWFWGARDLRAAYRFWAESKFRAFTLGFRVGRTL
jgi:formylglycine-generating enzyme required for sulfatase activity